MQLVHLYTLDTTSPEIPLFCERFCAGELDRPRQATPNKARRADFSPNPLYWAHTVSRSNPPPLKGLGPGRSESLTLIQRWRSLPLHS
jgi:hypothetical protein